MLWLCIPIALCTGHQVIPLLCLCLVLYSIGACVALSVAALGLLALHTSLYAFCYLIFTTQPRGLDDGLQLQAPGTEEQTPDSYWRLVQRFKKQLLLIYVVVVYGLYCVQYVTHHTPVFITASI